MEEIRIIEVKQSVFADNDEKAEELRQKLREKGCFLVNIMSSPGSGKTSIPVSYTHLTLPTTPYV